MTLCSVKEQNPQTVANESGDLELNRFCGNQLQQSKSTQTQSCLPYANATECISMDELTIMSDNDDFI